MGVTALYIPYKKDFEPIVRINENVAIPLAGLQLNYFKVLYIEPVPLITITKSLSALEKSVAYTLDELKLNENEAGQWRLVIPDYVSILMKFPRAATKWVTQGQEAPATPVSMNMPNLLEFYTWKDYVPLLELTNPVNEDQLIRLFIWGFKYSLQPLEKPPKEYTILPVFSAENIVGGEVT